MNIICPAVKIFDQMVKKTPDNSKSFASGQFYRIDRDTTNFHRAATVA